MLGLILVGGIVVIAFAVTGWVLYGRALSRDPSAIRRAEEALQQATARFEAAAEKLESRVVDIETNCVLSALLSDEQLPVTRIGATHAIESAIERIADRVIAQKLSG